MFVLDFDTGGIVDPPVVELEAGGDVVVWETESLVGALLATDEDSESEAMEL